MEVVYDRVDIAACLASGNRNPVQIVERRVKELWLVPDAVRRLDGPVTWSTTRTGTKVAIPLVPYLLHGEPAMALAYMAVLMHKLNINIDQECQRMHLVIGMPLEEVPPLKGQPDLTLRYWLGVGLMYEE
jgi:hypothetical protein